MNKSFGGDMFAVGKPKRGKSLGGAGGGALCRNSIGEMNESQEQKEIISNLVDE